MPRISKSPAGLGRIVSLFLPLYLILNQYPVGPFTVGNIILLVLAFLYYLESWGSSRRFYPDKYLLLLLGYILLVNSLAVIFRGVLGGQFFASVLSLLIVLFLCTALKSLIDFNELLGSYRAVSVIVCSLLLFQAFQVYVNGESVSPVLVFPLLDTVNWTFDSDRPLSFFQEPQALVNWLAPLLYFEIKGNHLLRAFGLTICIALCGSTSGVAILVFVWAYSLCCRRPDGMRMLLIALVTIGAICSFLYAPVFEESRIKLFNAISLIGGFSPGFSVSDYSRLFKAFDTYCELDLVGKIFGIGYGTLASLVASGAFSFSWMHYSGMDSAQYMYMSTLFGVFVMYGAIGGALFWLSVLQYSVSNGRNARFFSLLIFLCAMSSSILFNGLFIFYYVLCLSFAEQNAEGSSKERWLSK